MFLLPLLPCIAAEAGVSAFFHLCGEMRGGATEHSALVAEVLTDVQRDEPESVKGPSLMVTFTNSPIDLADPVLRLKVFT